MVKSTINRTRTPPTKGCGFVHELQSRRSRSAAQFVIVVEEIAQGVVFQAGLRRLPAQRGEPLPGRLEQRMSGGALEIGEIGGTQVKPRVFGGESGNGNAIVDSASAAELE